MKAIKRFGNAWDGLDGILNREGLVTIDEEAERENRRQGWTTLSSQHAWALSCWLKVLTDALVGNDQIAGLAI